MYSLAGILPTLGMPELLVLLLIVVIIFGASKLPQLGKGLGEGIRNFKRGMRGDEPEHDAPDAPHDAPQKPGG
jgi:sec-independent protein translocase protein TatA